MAGKAVCMDSYFIQVQYVHVRGWSTDTVHVRVYSNHVQTANMFSGDAQYAMRR